MSPAEHALVAQVVADQPGTTSEELLTKQAEALGLVLRRSPAAVLGSIQLAQQRLQERALAYVDAHHTAMTQALSAGENDVAGKLAWQAIERLSAKSEDGKTVERIVEPAPRADLAAASSAVQVNINIPMGARRPAMDA